jgi:hypothetical protein
LVFANDSDNWFFVAADAVLISYGFAQKLAGILLVASALPIGILFIFLIVWSVIEGYSGGCVKVQGDYG